MKKHPCLRWKFWRIAVFSHLWDHGEIIFSDDACAVERYTCKRCGEQEDLLLGKG